VDYRLRQNAARINKGIRNFSRLVGQDVKWYEFIPQSVEDVDSTDSGTGFDDDLYDEGGEQVVNGHHGASARWKAPKIIRVVQAIINEGSQQFRETGSYSVDTLTLIVQYEELVRKGLANPANRGAHTNDRIGFDGRIFSVDMFNPRGRIATVPGFTVSIQALEVKEDELLDGPNWFELPFTVPPVVVEGALYPGSSTYPSSSLYPQGV
jgi:hypothetical protein